MLNIARMDAAASQMFASAKCLPTQILNEWMCQRKRDAITNNDLTVYHTQRTPLRGAVHRFLVESALDEIREAHYKHKDP